MTKPNVLVSSAGRRVGLLNCFRESIAGLGVSRMLCTVDFASSAPASFVADLALRVPHCTDPSFVDVLLDFCRERHIGLIIPTIDTELPIFAMEREKFSKNGVTVSISSPLTVEICRNKNKTNEWLLANRFPAVRQTDLRSALAQPSDWPPPLIAKPKGGSASIGMRRLQTAMEMEALAEVADGYVVEEIATGREYTINVYVNVWGECVCAIPHHRMEVRSGEVSKGVTVKDRRLMDLGREVAEALPGAYGALNIQCFMDDSGTIRVFEINARFGGGYPLAHRAGGRFTDWLLDELEGRHLPYFDEWTDDLAMLRYDEAVFVPGERIRTWSQGSALFLTSTTLCT